MARIPWLYMFLLLSTSVKAEDAPAQEEPTAPSQELELGAVTVTVDRAKRRKFEVRRSVEILDEKSIAHRQPKTVADLLDDTPGAMVQKTNAGAGAPVLRGLIGPDNLILMDGIPLYYASHMQGLYSVFNSEAVDRLKVYKGGIPAHFGGRGASVLYVKTRDAKEYHAKLSAGLITSKFSLEAPVIKDRLSLFLAGRSTKLSIGRWHDRIRESNGETDGSGGKGGRSVRGKGSSGDDFYFFDPNESWMDLNGKIFYKISDRNRLYLSGYVGRDSALVAGGLTEWGNRAASLRWNHRFNAKLISNTSLIYSRYYTQQTGGIYKFRSGIKTSSFRQEFSYFPNEGNRVTFGFVSEYQDFNHGGLEDITENFGKFMPPMQSLESALFLENDQKISSRLSVYYGLRYSLFHRLGPGDGFM